MVKISPSILSADFSCLEKDVRKVEKRADFIHVDVMDGCFVPSISFGSLIVKTLKNLTKVPLDVHLMVADPCKHFEEFIDAGSDFLTLHIESTGEIEEAIKKIKDSGKKAGIALNPGTSLSAIERLIKKGDLDVVTVMTVNPGFSGQKFIEGVVPKIRELRRIIDGKKMSIQISVDGGINSSNARSLVFAGADILVMGSAIFGTEDPERTIEEIWSILNL